MVVFGCLTIARFFRQLIQKTFKHLRMTKTFRSIVLLTLSVSILGCSKKTFVVAPPFTDVKKILNLHDGMSIDDVNKNLGIEPYDVLFLSGGGGVCYYNYRLKDRKINISNTNDFHDLSSESKDKNLSSEKAQTYGSTFYSEWKKLYCTFKEGKLTDFVSITGVEDANYLLLVNGSIKLLSTKPLEYSHFSKLTPNYINGEAKVTPETKDRDIIDGILFPLRNDGGFKKSNPPRKKKTGIGLFPGNQENEQTPTIKFDSRTNAQ